MKNILRQFALQLLHLWLPEEFDSDGWRVGTQQQSTLKFYIVELGRNWKPLLISTDTNVGSPRMMVIIDFSSLVQERLRRLRTIFFPSLCAGGQMSRMCKEFT